MDPQVIDYARAHWRSLYDYSESEYKRIAARYKYNYNNILLRDKSAKVLDVGSAGGFFLYFLRLEGFTNIQGIDADESAVEAARSMNLPVQQADAFEFLLNAKVTYDCIILNQVLEHFPRDVSLSLLRLCQGALRPGGLLFAAVPNAMNPFAGFLMYSDLSHDHLYVPKSLEDSMIVAGFEQVSIHPEGPAPYDLLTTARWALSKVRELGLRILFAIDVGLGRRNRLQCIFTSSIIARGQKLTG